ETFPWQEMVPDQSLILNENPADSAYMVSAIGGAKDYILVYTPMGRPVQVNLNTLNTPKVKAFWFNPRSGKYLFIGDYSNSETPIFKPWSLGRGSDFVLVILDKDSSFLLPGMMGE
ncbi:MAG TPA: putative collagen-binding domain-containing protein, partial [Bacteroidales bacterium]|nr:putative collagen-binding domain-containing protein [Bacteroidales bacterium]